jgi:lipopolysaccharide heptosyltransferase II
MPGSPEKVLVVGPAWVGDMVMSQSLYQVLQDSRPNVEIDVLAPPWSEPLIERMPQVNRAILKPIGHGELGLGRRRKLGKLLRQGAYDQAIILPNSFKSALAPFLAAIPRRTGWRGEMRYGLLNDMRILNAQELPLMVQRFAALGLTVGEPLPPQLPHPQLIVDEANALRCAAKFELDPGLPILALCPGAEFGAAKRWPARYYAEIARNYLARDWQVVLFGSAKDRGVTGQIMTECEGHSLCHDLAGRTELAQAVDLLSLAGLVLSNDSGLMHIAAALQRPLLAVYGPTSPGFTPPLGERVETLVSDIECAPCFARECPLGHHRCMEDISPDQLAVKLQSLSAGSPRV